MATLQETIWVHNLDELNSTVQRLVSQGGVVQSSTEDEVVVHVKKKLNILVLVVGLLLCIGPGLAYLVWYLTADQSQAITVKIGSAPNIGGYKPDGQPGGAAPAPPMPEASSPGAAPGAAPAPPPAPGQIPGAGVAPAPPSAPTAGGDPYQAAAPPPDENPPQP